MTVDAPAFALAAAAGPGLTVAGLPLADGTVGYLAGEWDVARQIADHRTGQAGSFRGRASFQPVSTGAESPAEPASLVRQPDLGGEPDQDGQPGHAGQPELDGRVLDFTERGELRFGGHRGPASRALVYYGRSDGGADVRFADGREFYRIDLSYGSSQAAHPCHSDRYVVTVTRLSPDTFSEVWRVTGPAKDYDMTTVYTPRGSRRVSDSEYAGTIPRLLLTAAERDADGVWLRSDQGTASFGAAVTAVGLTAAYLRSAGVRTGDLVLLTASTTPLYLLCWLALTSLGAVAVAVNPRSSAAELSGLIFQVQPRLLISDPDLTDLVAAARQDGARADADRAGAAAFPPVFDVGELVPADWNEPAAMVAAGRRAALPHAAVRPDDLAALIPTSGTTGRSKLVMQTHRTYAMAGEGFPFWMELTAADRMMTTLPLFHINAPAYSVMGSLACGAGLVLAGRFSAGSFLDVARRHGATEFNAIGAMLEILMRQPERPDDADTPLRLCYTGPAPERERQLEIERRFGLRIVVGYALSESPYGLIWPHRSRPYGTLGTVRQHPYLGTINHARIVSDTGAVLGPGGTGELELRNPVLTPGYFGMPDETAAVMDGGWLRTGDLVTAGSDGSYTFVSRVKEVIRRRGENLSPLEVEEVLGTHPAVLEAAVVGVPSELSEEEVKAFVVATAGERLDFGELHAYAADRLAAFKVPRYWEQIDELPRTATARVAKHLLPTASTPDEYDAARCPGDSAATGGAAPGAHSAGRGAP